MNGPFHAEVPGACRIRADRVGATAKPGVVSDGGWGTRTSEAFEGEIN